MLGVFLHIVFIEHPAAVKIGQIFDDVGETVDTVPLVVDAYFAVFADGGNDFFGINIGADAKGVVCFATFQGSQFFGYLLAVAGIFQFFLVIAVFFNVFMIQTENTAAYVRIV